MTTSFFSSSSSFLLFAAVLVILVVGTCAGIATAATSYSVSISYLSTTPIISHQEDNNSDFDFSYNPAAFLSDKNEVCLMVRCQNSTSGKNPLGHVTASVQSLSCSPNPLAGFSPIKKSSVVFHPESAADVLGTEDARIKRIPDGTLLMFYTAVAVSPAGGATARLALASCKGDPSNPSCWQRHGPLFPDPTPGFQFTKSGALLVDDSTPSSKSYLIFGDCTIVNGLQVAIASSDFMKYDVIENFLLIEPRKRNFDSELVESGPPPIRLPDGNWFFVYNSAQRIYGVPNRLMYNPGFVILNGSDPLQVLQRSDEPLMMPNRYFQTEGLTPYVVFVEGMISSRGGGSSSSSQQSSSSVRVRDTKLAKSVATTTSGEVSFDLYWGAADSAVGVATVTVKYSS